MKWKLIWQLFMRVAALGLLVLGSIDAGIFYHNNDVHFALRALLCFAVAMMSHTSGEMQK